MTRPTVRRCRIFAAAVLAALSGQVLLPTIESTETRPLESDEARDADGKVDIRAATVSGLLTVTAGLSVGMTTVAGDGTLDGLLDIAPASAATVAGRVTGDSLNDGGAVTSLENRFTPGVIYDITITAGTVTLSDGNLLKSGGNVIAAGDAATAAITTFVSNGGSSIPGDESSTGSPIFGVIDISTGSSASANASSAVSASFVTDGTLTATAEGERRITSPTAAVGPESTLRESEIETTAESIAANGTIKGTVLTDDGVPVATSVGNLTTDGTTIFEDTILLSGDSKNAHSVAATADGLTAAALSSSTGATTSAGDVLTVSGDGLTIGKGVTVGPGWGLNSNAFMAVSASVTVDMTQHNGKILSVTGSGSAVDVQFIPSDVGLVDIRVVGDIVGADLTLSCPTSTMAGAVTNSLGGTVTPVISKDRVVVVEPKAGSMLRVIVNGVKCFISGNTLGEVLAI